jgi:DeoR family glycerol-3-phosphate regulon repressor
LQRVRATAWVEVEDLAAHFGVVVQTIRRDLAEMVEAGQVARVHGGAVARSGVAILAYEARRGMAEAAKTAIGRAVAAQVPQNASVILNIGTTTEAVAQALVHHGNLTVISNNMNIANILSANPNAEVIVVGGALRRSDGGLIGDLVGEGFAKFKVDYAGIGASEIDAEGDLLDFDLAEVRVSQMILRQSRSAWMVAEAGKLARRASVRIGSLADLDRLFTDQPLPVPLSDLCAHWQTEVVVFPA